MVQLCKPVMRENSALKAGHPPAVMAGGMRISKKGSEETAPLEKEARRPSDKPRYHLGSPPTVSRMQSVSILLAGTLAKLGHEFPATPVSIRHGKLRPALEKLHSPRMFNIQQPRKC